eukprot:jgi/Mesen1/6187/ME000032S05478
MRKVEPKKDDLQKVHSPNSNEQVCESSAAVHPYSKGSSESVWVENVKYSNLHRTWSGSECSHTASIFEKPYASIKDSYDVGRVLGQGQFGCVRICYRKETREAFAVKVILKTSLKNSEAVEIIREEVALMLAVGEHPTVVALRDIVEDSKLCPGGDLFDRISERRHFPEGEAADVCASVAEVLRHCRSRGVVHRDLKPENILLCNRDSHTSIRIADFGAGSFLQPGQKLTALAGSPDYVAPEVIDGCYSYEADVWSTGVVLYVLLCGIPPFWARDEAGVLAAIRRGHVDMSWGPWRGVSQGAKELVRRMLTVDPALRITPQQILEHPWIVEHTIPVARPKASGAGNGNRHFRFTTLRSPRFALFFGFIFLVTTVHASAALSSLSDPG